MTNWSTNQKPLRPTSHSRLRLRAAELRGGEPSRTGIAIIAAWNSIILLHCTQSNGKDADRLMCNRYKGSATMESPNNTYWLDLAREKQMGGPQLTNLLLTRAIIATLVVASAITVSTGIV